MSGIPNLANYRRVLQDYCNKKDLKRVEMEMLLWGDSWDCFEIKDAQNMIGISKPTAVYGLRYLNKEGYLGILKEKSKYNNRLYHLTMSGTAIVTRFYRLLQTHEKL